MDLITKIKNDQIEIFQKSLLTGLIKEHSEIICCNSLGDFMNNDVRKSTDFNALFDVLKSMKGPVLYLFEIISENTHEEIRQKLIKYKNTVVLEPILQCGNILFQIQSTSMLEK